MRLVDLHFVKKYERKRNMTQLQIKEEKQRKFLQKTKENLFKIVDIADRFGSQTGTKDDDVSTEAQTEVADGAPPTADANF